MSIRIEIEDVVLRVFDTLDSAVFAERAILRTRSQKCSTVPFRGGFVILCGDTVYDCDGRIPAQTSEMVIRECASSGRMVII
jgi:hypothetical protein